MTRYERPPDRADALRLHLNENTAGCSPAVLEAIQRVSRTQIGFYPAYEAAIAACAAYVGVPEARLVLTNGLDEGLLAATVAGFRLAQTVASLPEAIVVEPTFEMYGIYTRAAGGRVVPVPSGPNFAFPLDGILRSITADTRIIFLANPNNPTGQIIPREAIRAIAAAAPPEVIVLLDEAYFEFSGETFLGEIDHYPNIILGRTFAKAFGLAGLRVGCLVSWEEALEPIRDVVPPYSVNVLAAVGLAAALADREHLAWYQAQVEQSKRLVYQVCDRLGLPYWPSAGNFVLLQIGDRATEVVKALERRRIMIRDRSRDPASPGCVRIAAGVVEHSTRCLAALEEVLCAAR